VEWWAEQPHARLDGEVWKEKGQLSMNQFWDRAHRVAQRERDGAAQSRTQSVRPTAHRSRSRGGHSAEGGVSSHSNDEHEGGTGTETDTANRIAAIGHRLRANRNV
jgi:hypothetical protein